MKRNTTIIVLIIVLIVAVAGLFVIRNNQTSLPENPKTIASPTPFESIEITGEIVCLPHKNPGEFQTMECAFGIKDNNTGNYYGLAFDPEENDLTMTGETVTVKGDFSEVPDSIYDIVGKIDVVSVTSN